MGLLLVLIFAFQIKVSSFWFAIVTLVGDLKENSWKLPYECWVTDKEVEESKFSVETNEGDWRALRTRRWRQEEAEGNPRRKQKIATYNATEGNPLNWRNSQNSMLTSLFFPLLSSASSSVIDVVGIDDDENKSQSSNGKRVKIGCIRSCHLYVWIG